MAYLWKHTGSGASCYTGFHFTLEAEPSGYWGVFDPTMRLVNHGTAKAAVSYAMDAAQNAYMAHMYGFTAAMAQAGVAGPSPQPATVAASVQGGTGVGASLTTWPGQVGSGKFVAAHSGFTFLAHRYEVSASDTLTIAVQVGCMSGDRFMFGSYLVPDDGVARILSEVTFNNGSVTRYVDGNDGGTVPDRGDIARTGRPFFVDSGAAHVRALAAKAPGAFSSKMAAAFPLTSWKTVQMPISNGAIQALVLADAAVGTIQHPEANAAKWNECTACRCELFHKQPKRMCFLCNDRGR